MEFHERSKMKNYLVPITKIYKISKNLVKNSHSEILSKQVIHL